MINPDDAASPAPRPALRRPSRGGRGFVLVAVIWSLGLITILASFGIIGARFRERAAADVLAEARAAAAADGGISLGIARAFSRAPDAGAAVPWRCVLPGGEHLAIAIADEIGKVDLNIAPPALLSALFSNLARDRDEGARIAADIVTFRTAIHDPGRVSADTDASVEAPSSEVKAPRNEALVSAGALSDTLARRYASDGKPEGPKRAPFVTILELDQVVGVPHALFAAALPFVTVRARRPDVDFFHATPTMRRLFGIGDAGAGTPQPPGHREMTITAEATTPEGARFVREALVSIGGANDGGGAAPYVIHEWRRADRGIPAEAFGNDGEDGAALDDPCFSGPGRS